MKTKNILDDLLFCLDVRLYQTMFILFAVLLKYNATFETIVTIFAYRYFQMRYTRMCYISTKNSIAENCHDYVSGRCFFGCIFHVVKSAQLDLSLFSILLIGFVWFSFLYEYQTYWFTKRKSATNEIANDAIHLHKQPLFLTVSIVNFCKNAITIVTYYKHHPFQFIHI